MLELDHLTVSGDVTFGNKSHSRYERLIFVSVYTLCAYRNLLFLYTRERLSLSLITETESTSRPERCWRTRSFQETCASWTTEAFTTELQPRPSIHLDTYTCVETGVRFECDNQKPSICLTLNACMKTIRIYCKCFWQWILQRAV